MKKYITYEDPLQGRIFTEKQMYEVYRDMADEDKKKADKQAQRGERSSRGIQLQLAYRQ